MKETKKTVEEKNVEMLSDEDLKDVTGGIRINKYNIVKKNDDENGKNK